MAQYNSKIVLGNGTVLIDLTADTVDASHVLKDYTFHDKTGAPVTGTNTFDSDTSEDTAAVSEILAGKSAHARGAKMVGTMRNNGAVTGHIATKNGTYTIPQGYHDGSGTVDIDSAAIDNLKAENIRQGVVIMDITGTMSGSEDVKAQTKTVSAAFTEQTVTPDTGFNYMTQVTVSAIPVSYSDNAAGGKTVTIG